jgi:phosphatidylglycerophosphate synthase
MTSTHSTAEQAAVDGPAGSGPRTSVGARYRHALAELGSKQKTAKGAPAYSRFVNRRLGRHLAALAWALDRTPNQVTALSAVCTGTGIIALGLLTPSAALALFVTLTLVLGYALDSADGQLARLRGGGSSAGEWLDHVVDSLKTGALHTAVLVHLYRTDLSDRWLLVPLLYAAVASSWFFTVILTDQLRRAHARASGTPVVPPGAAAPLWRSLLALPTDYGVLCLVFLLLAVPRAFTVVYALMLCGTMAVFAAALVSWYRELRGWDSAPPVRTTP